MQGVEGSVSATAIRLRISASGTDDPILAAVIKNFSNQADTIFRLLAVVTAKLPNLDPFVDDVCGILHNTGK